MYVSLGFTSVYVTFPERFARRIPSFPGHLALRMAPLSREKGDGDDAAGIVRHVDANGNRFNYIAIDYELVCNRICVVFDENVVVPRCKV